MVEAATTQHSGPLLAGMELCSNPMFLLSVSHDGELRFAGVNSAHTEATGIHTSAIAGFRPDQVLPPRLAETVMANYNACLRRRAVIAYEECLDLPNGRKWWSTSLKPVWRDDRLCAIVGTATDITADKSAIATRSRHRQKAERRLDREHRQIARAREELRGPLGNILTLSRMLKDSARDETAAISAGLIADLAGTALTEFDRQAPRASRSDSDVEVAINFGRMCRDLAAIIDPEAKLKIGHPDFDILCDDALLQSFLIECADEIAHLARTWVRILLVPHPVETSVLRLTVKMDTFTADTPNLGALSSIAQDHGYELNARVLSNEIRLSFLIGGRVLASDVGMPVVKQQRLAAAQ